MLAVDKLVVTLYMMLFLYGIHVEQQQATGSRDVDSVITVEPQSETGMDTLTHPVPSTATTISTVAMGE